MSLIYPSYFSFTRRTSRLPAPASRLHADDDDNDDDNDDVNNNIIDGKLQPSPSFKGTIVITETQF